jgi:DNA-binding NtrC family response regulator
MSTTEAPRVLLLLEPDILIRMVVGQYLRECGYTVIAGVSASNFRTLIDNGCQLDIVVADVALSGDTSGFELARSIRQTHPGTDVILTSGVETTAQQAHELCHEGPIRKPYHPKDVEALMRKLQARRRANRACEDDNGA